ncbi:fluoride efflux transporter FluC [Planctomonas deserti]|uniref:fluoride efflux transporter FluC n=1 Tax=Planctomonas deserti TaxID=2144185 RepID=UPI000D344001|nr:CrcB family protein [Planctomonas deserti]
MRATRAASGGPPALPAWRSVVLVLVGGTVGTALREAITLVVPRVGDVPVATVGINIVGAFLLGVLLERLTHSGPDVGARQDLRLLVGVGALGGFTTYSALALDTVLLGSRDSAAVALLYALGTLLAGAVASWAGIAVAARTARREAGRT